MIYLKFLFLVRLGPDFSILTIGPENNKMSLKEICNLVTLGYFYRVLSGYSAHPHPLHKNCQLRARGMELDMIVQYDEKFWKNLMTFTNSLVNFCFLIVEKWKGFFLSRKIQSLWSLLFGEPIWVKIYQASTFLV